MSNRYGIDLGKIMQTTSALKTAKLRRDKLKRDMDREGYEDEAYGSFIEKDSPNSMVAAIDADESGDISEEEKRAARRKTGMKYNALSKIEARTEKRIDRKQIRSGRAAAQGRARRAEQRTIDRQKKKDAREAKEHSAEVAYYKRMGASNEESEIMATNGAAKSKKMVSAVEDMEENQQYQVLNSINKGGQELNNVIELGTQNPLEGEKAWQTIRKGKQDQVNKLYKDGRKEEAGQAEESLSGMAETLLKEDGTFNVGKAGKYLTDLTRQERDIKEAIDFKKGKRNKNGLTEYQKQTKAQSDRTYKKDIAKQQRKNVDKALGVDEFSSDEDKAKASAIKEEAEKLIDTNPDWSITKRTRVAKEKVEGKGSNAIKKASQQSGNLKASKKFYGKKITYKGKGYNVDNKGNMTPIK